MNTSLGNQSPPDNRIDCREVNGQLLLRLYPSSHRILTRFGGMLLLLVFFTGFLLVALFVWEASLPVLAAIGFFELVLFVFAVAAMAAPFLRTTSVLLTKDRAVIKTVLYGKERSDEYSLATPSRARQWYYPPRPSRRNNPDFSGPQGIEIGDAADLPVEGSDLVVVVDLNDESNPRFGDGLSRGELDWLVWRINQFLDPTTATKVTSSTSEQKSVEAGDLIETSIPCPEHTKVRIVESPSESRIVFPNSMQTGSFSGIRSVLLGIVLLAYPLYRILQWGREAIGGTMSVTPTLFILAIIALLGLAELLKGLTRLVGCRELKITSQTITYRTTLFGIALPLKLSTAEIISVGLPRDVYQRRRTEQTRILAPAVGCVIRTSERNLTYAEAIRPLTQEEKTWIVGEVARRIEAIRSANQFTQR